MPDQASERPETFAGFQDCFKDSLREVSVWVIHGGHVLIDQEKFFGETEPYWTPLFSEHYGSFLLVEFPARFLASLLHNCIEGYRFILSQRAKSLLTSCFRFLRVRY